jgi:hypothetical protein
MVLAEPALLPLGRGPGKRRVRGGGLPPAFPARGVAARETVTGVGSQWSARPVLPPGTTTLAPAPGGTITALTVHRAMLTVWQAPPGGTHWTKAQTISVPIQYGFSG